MPGVAPVCIDPTGSSSRDFTGEKQSRAGVQAGIPMRRLSMCFIRVNTFCGDGLLCPFYHIFDTNVFRCRTNN
jgi:hypothetical protein